MTISNTFFWIFLGILILIFLISIFLDKTKLKHRFFTISSFVSGLIIFFLIIGKIFFFPTVYRIIECYKYDKTILIIPNKNQGYYNGIYVVNLTNNDLKLKSNIYGIHKSDEIVIDETIKPHAQREFKISEIDYILKKIPSRSRFTEHESNTRYSLQCKVSDYQNSDNLTESKGEKTGTTFWKIVFYIFIGLIILILFGNFYFYVEDRIKSTKR